MLSLYENYPSAISELTDWLEIVKRYKIKDYYQRRDTLIYPELAELYLNQRTMKMLKNMLTSAVSQSVYKH